MIALRAAGIGKAYRLYQRPVDSLKELLFRREYAETFWALRDVTLEVPVGGSLGIIGDNGAGKSTLLRLLAGASAPTAGTVERRGLTSAMLSLGAGFHPDLSGRDNIRIGCAVLGLSAEETDRLQPTIEEFSELGEFLDRPVRTYSSGMQLRLGFSVATAVEPEILVVDEHLSVGDQHFRHKCMRRIQALREQGCALVFCSHDLYAVREVCERTLWLHEGQPRMLAATAEVVDAYHDHVRQQNAPATDSEAAPAPPTADEPSALVTAIDLVGGGTDPEYTTGSELRVRIVVRLGESVRPADVNVASLIVRNDGIWCYGTHTGWSSPSVELAPIGEGLHAIDFHIPELPLLSGQYSFTVALLSAHSPLVHHTIAGAVPFRVTNPGNDVGLARIPHHWRALREIDPLPGRTSR